MKTFVTVKQLQQLVNQACEDLTLRKPPSAQPERDGEKVEEKIRYYQGSFLFGQWDPDLAYYWLERYIPYWAWNYIAWDEPQFSEDSDYDFLIALQDLGAHIKRLGFELVYGFN